VEDRTSPGLWIELVESSWSDYSSRANRLAGSDGVVSAWWGENANPRRTDLPRKIPEFGILALYETDDGFTVPEPAQGSPGFHFRRTPRPGQGIVTAEPTTGVLLVLISPRDPEAANALRDWADFVHIRHIAAVSVPGYTMITPYENATGGSPRYMHLYEMNSDDPEATFASMRPLVEARLGKSGTPEFDSWAWHEQLRIEYVNTFGRVRATTPGGP
jgi:hypothetical protein